MDNTFTLSKSNTTLLMMCLKEYKTFLSKMSNRLFQAGLGNLISLLEQQIEVNENKETS